MSRTRLLTLLRDLLKIVIVTIRRLLLRQALLELLLVTGIGLLYVTYFAPPLQGVVARNLDPQPLLNVLFNPEMRQTGLEHERLAGVLIPAEIGLRLYGYIPAWNPLMGTGEPLINNAFSYLFNPFYSLPVLLLGIVQGSKLAMILALLIAGYSMWALARSIGIGAVGRVTTAALYMMSGGIAGKFYGGHFQLGLSLAWPPLVMAGLIWTLRTRDRRAPVLMAVAFALLFFSGNIYYTLHTLISMGVVTLFHLWERRPDSGYWMLRKDRLLRVVIGGLLAFGLASLQFIPVWAVRDFVDHPVQYIDSASGQLAGNYDLAQAVVNLIYPWPKWIIFDQPTVGLDAIVDYAYVGTVVIGFILCGLAVTLFFLREDARRYARMAAAALLLALLMMIWATGQTPVLEWLYQHIKLLAEFRFVGRALAIAGLWWIVLAGIGLDILWRAADRLAPVIRRGSGRRLPRMIEWVGCWRLSLVMAVAMLTWGYFFVYSLAGQSLRLSMIFYNYRLLNTLDERRFTGFPQAVETLWLFMLIALAVDMALWLVWQGVQSIRRRVWLDGHALIARLVRAGIVTAALAGIADVMTANSSFFTFGTPIVNYPQLYAFAQQAEPETPFPAVNFPFTPVAYDAYYAGIRNWGLNEGWTPVALPGVLEEGQVLVNLPRWAVVIADDVFGASGSFALRFVTDNHYALRDCQPLTYFPVGQPCEPGMPATALLYENEAALPYAFVVSGDQLQGMPDALTRDNILPAAVLAHTMDTMTIEAATPTRNETGGTNPLPQYYLVVEETHFPGWEAFVDDTPLPTVTIQTVNQPTEPTKGFIGIPLQSGTHTYKLRFQPPGFVAGIIVFVITLVAIAIYLRPGQKTSV